MPTDRSKTPRAQAQRGRLQEAPTDPDAVMASVGPVEPEAPAPLPSLSTRTLMARLPLYQQIAEDLRAQIESGQLAPGQPIPSETTLIEQYGVSRITARAAVRALRDSGLVITEHGRATRVRDTPATVVDVDPTIHVALTDPATPAGRRRSRAATVEYGTWDAAWDLVEEPSHYRGIARGPAAGPLGLPDAAPMFVTERLLTRDGAVTAHTMYVPLQVAAAVPGVETDPFAGPPALYAALVAAGHDLTWTDTVTARMPTPDEVTALGMPPGVPVLVHHRTTHGADGPMLHEVTRLNPQRVTLAQAAPVTAGLPASPSHSE